MLLNGPKNTSWWPDTNTDLFSITNVRCDVMSWEWIEEDYNPFEKFPAAAKTALEFRDCEIGAFFLMKMRITAVRYPVRQVTTCANETCEGLVPMVNGVCPLCPGSQHGSEPQLEVDLLLITDNGVEVEGTLGRRRTTAYVAPHGLEGPDGMMDPFDMWSYVDETVFPAGTEIDGQGWYKTRVNTKTGIVGEVGKLHIVNWRLCGGDWPPKHPDAAPEDVLQLPSHETRPADDSAAADPSRPLGSCSCAWCVGGLQSCPAAERWARVRLKQPLAVTLKRTLCHLVLSMAAGRTPSLESIVGLRSAIRERCPLDLRNQSREDAHVHWEVLAAAAELAMAQILVPRDRFCNVCATRLPQGNVLTRWTLAIAPMQRDVEAGINAIAERTACAQCAAALGAGYQGAEAVPLQTGNVLVVKRHGVAWQPSAQVRLGGEQYDLQGVVVHTPDHYIAHVKVADGTLYGMITVLRDVHFPASRWCLAFYVQNMEVPNAAEALVTLSRP